MKVTIAIDSFKGSLDSISAGKAAADGVLRAFPNAKCDVYPLADGGEGTVEALVSGMAGTLHKVNVTGPNGKQVIATYGILPGNIAVMEMAQAAGITLLSESERNPLTTTTRGVGEMILDAASKGVKKIIMGIGGSATNDAGAGMLQALGWRLLDDKGNELAPGGAQLANLATIIPPPSESLPEISMRIACDVTNPLCGIKGASAVYGPQKGASPADVTLLDNALNHFASLSQGESDAPGAGAAGGLGYALKTFLKGELVPGVDLVIEEIKLEKAIVDADVVITGEGRLDGQTVMGKAPIGVARLAKKYGKRVIAFAGCVGDGVEAVNTAGIDAFFPILRRVTTLEEAMATGTAAANLTSSAEQAFRLLGTALN
ncbi:MAG: glycerate kinase [Kiritimatiellae bacterium]|nr:glycerate kinase [Kiritimatiellia bacterium]